MGFMFRLSLLNMKRRRTRTLLTILGVTIGVISVVALLALGFGVKREMLKSFGDESSVKQIIVRGSQNYKEKNKLLTERNMEKFAVLDHVSNVYPMYEVETTFNVGNYYGWVTLTGIPSEELAKLKLTKESSKPSESQSSKKPGLYMGNSMGYLFYNWKTSTSYKEGEKTPFKDLVHSKIEGQFGYDEESGFKDKLTIDGFLEGDEDSFSEYSQRAFCDLDTLKKYLKRNAKTGVMLGQLTDDNGNALSEFTYSSAVVVVDDIDNVEFVVKKLQDMGFQTENEKEYLDSAKRTVNIVQILLFGIGTIALLVALIGISNTMTTSVYDRVNEIGVLKVVGCDLDELVGMFLFEAGVLGFVGGIFGVVLSFGIKGLLDKIAVAALHFKVGTELAVIPWWLVLAAVVLSTVFGILAGYFPARWASKMNPLEAVRK